MTALAIEPEPVPLVRDNAGRLMALGTRVSLDVLVAAFKRGKTPEAIHQGYETIPLADAYAIFTYYLRHRAEVDAYKLRELREMLALTQTDLAESLEISQKRVSEIERGRVDFTKVDTLRRYVDALGGTRRVSVQVGDETYHVA